MITFACHYLKSRTLSCLSCVWSVLFEVALIVIQWIQWIQWLRLVLLTLVRWAGVVYLAPLKWRFMLNIPRKLIMSRSLKIMLIALICRSCYCRHSGLFGKHLLAISSWLIRGVFINQWRSFWPSGFLWLTASSLGFSSIVWRRCVEPDSHRFLIPFMIVCLTLYFGHIDEMEWISDYCLNYNIVLQLLTTLVLQTILY